MEKRSEGKKGVTAGIRLNYLNLVLITLGLIAAVLMVVTMYQTRDSVEEIVKVTSSYLDDQATGGMLQSITPAMTESAIAFVQSGEPVPAMAFAGQKKTLDDQIILYTTSENYSEEAKRSLARALLAYGQLYAMQERAMALAAGTLPEPLFHALPEFLQQAQDALPEKHPEIGVIFRVTEEFRIQTFLYACQQLFIFFCTGFQDPCIIKYIFDIK